MDRHTDRERERDRQIDKQMDRETDRQTDKHAFKQIGIHTYGGTGGWEPCYCFGFGKNPICSTLESIAYLAILDIYTILVISI